MVEVSILAENEAKNIDSHAKLPAAVCCFHLLIKICPMRSAAQDQRTQHHAPNAPSSAGPWLRLGDTSRAKPCRAGVREGGACWIWIFASVQNSSAATLHQALCTGRWAVAHRPRSAWKANFPVCHHAAAWDALLNVEVWLRTRSPHLAAEPQDCAGTTAAVQRSGSREQQQVPALARPPATP